MFLHSKAVSLAFNPQPGGPGPRIYIPQWESGPVIPPGKVSILIALYDSQSYGGGILSRLHTGGMCVLIANYQNEFT
jgi:hypothetical protein